MQFISKSALKRLVFTAVFTAVAGLTIPGASLSQPMPQVLHTSDSDTITNGISLDAFMELVLRQNMELMIENFEVTAAQAAVVASRVFEDPELEVILPAFDRDDFGAMPRNIAFELEIPIELGRKRARRIQVARAEFEATKAGLEDFLRELRSEIASVYVSVSRQQLILEQMEDTRDQLDRLLEITVQLFEAGEISEVEVIQTRLEARNFQAEYLDELAELSDILTEAYVMMGAIPTEPLLFSRTLRVGDPNAQLDDLTQFALRSRTDIRVSELEIRVAEALLRQARSERIPTVNLIAGYHNEEAIRPAPGFRAVYAGFSVPLQFSGLNRGAVRESSAFLDQSRTRLDLTKLTVSSEVKSAFDKLSFASQKKNLFSESIVSDAERVRDAVVYSYQRGEATLLEVLEAQRTLNEVYVNYFDALSDYAFAVIELSEKSGRWLLEIE